MYNPSFRIYSKDIVKYVCKTSSSASQAALIL